MQVRIVEMRDIHPSHGVVVNEKYPARREWDENGDWDLIVEGPNGEFVLDSSSVYTTLTDYELVE